MKFQFSKAVCFLAVANLTILLAGCSSGGGLTQTTMAAAESYAGPTPLRGSDGPYRLGPGDKVRLKFYDDANLNEEYEVNSAGFVSIPLVGEVKASGLTTSQLEKAIARRMKGKIAQEPNVTAQISSYAPFYIFGEVKKAGFYPYQPGITVAGAIATAGGLTYRADENTIYLQHAGSIAQEEVKLTIPTRIFPGDNIRIGERMF
jgi:protein involved in polysaccharide export with SLBB domain